ncbi:MAG: hypothetical protein HC880_09140 [Bacteroidia bacterium]|nr:hypothetical protein [Bacteroidia bacterium]
MAMTAAEKQRVIDLLNQLDEKQRKRTLDSLENFVNWLRNSAYAIYQKIKDVLSDLWEWLADLF